MIVILKIYKKYKKNDEQLSALMLKLCSAFCIVSFHIIEKFALLLMSLCNCNNYNIIIIYIHFSIYIYI